MIYLGFLASNNGSGLRAAAGAIDAGQLDAEIRLVVSNKPGAPALTFARQADLPTLVLRTAADPEEADRRLAHAMRAAGVQWIVLSGYLRRLGPATLAAFPGRILNIHPALLPKFGGRGFYGRRVHEAVIAANQRVSGASVHIVDEEYDHGPVLARIEVPIEPGDTPETLERRVTAAEPRLLVETLQRIERSGIPFVEQPVDRLSYLPR